MDIAVIIGILGIIVTVVGQTIFIGYFIGSIKTVVQRVVKDVEKLFDLVVDIQSATAKMLRQEEKLLQLEARMDRADEHAAVLEGKIEDYRDCKGR